MRNRLFGYWSLVLLWSLVLGTWSFRASSADLITASITFTNFPTNGATITLQGSTRTWTNNITASPSTQITQTNSIPYSTTNLLNHLTAYPAASGHYLSQANSTNVSVRGKVAEVMTVTTSGGYATVTYSTQTVALTPTFIVRQPYTAEHATNQTNIASWSAKHLTLSTNPVDGIRLTNVIAFNGTIHRATNGWLTNTALDRAWITNGVADGTRLTNAIALHGTNHLLYGGTIDTATITNATITNAALVQGILLALTNGLLDGARLTNVLAVDGTLHSLTNGYWTNGILDVAIATNLVIYNGFSSLSTNAAGTVEATSLRAGAGARATNTQAMAIGNNALAGGNASLAMGNTAQATNSIAIAIGAEAIAGGAGAIAIGSGTTAYADNSLAILGSTDGTHTNSIVLGGSSTEKNQVVLGSSATISLVTAPGRVAAGSITNALLTGTNIFRGDVAWEEVSVSTFANGNNIAAPATNKFMRLVASGPTAAFSICGIQGGRSGRDLLIWNDTGQTMTLAHESGVDPTPANRIHCTSQGDVVFATNAIATLIYSAAKSRWIYGAPNTNSVLANNSVTDGILRDSAALSVIGRSANSSGDPADIAASTDGQVITVTNSTLAWRKLSFTNITFWDAKPVGQTNRQFIAWDAAGGYWTNVNALGSFYSFGQATGHNPADSTTYYFGGWHSTVSTSYNQSRIKLGEACRLKRVEVKIRVAGTLGTTETVSHYIRINDTTDVGQVDLTYDADNKDGGANLDQAIAASDYIAAKAVMPAFATNPTTVFEMWTLYFEEAP